MRHMLHYLPIMQCHLKQVVQSRLAARGAATSALQGKRTAVEQEMEECLQYHIGHALLLKQPEMTQPAQTMLQWYFLLLRQVHCPLAFYLEHNEKQWGQVAMRLMPKTACLMRT